MVTYILVGIIIFLMILLGLTAYRRFDYDGKIQVDTQRDIYRIVLNDLIDVEKKHKIVLRVEAHELSSMRENGDAGN